MEELVQKYLKSGRINTKMPKKKKKKNYWSHNLRIANHFERMRPR